jgi:Zn finger protein HypA/HybF involved in hydrogenase expression
MHQAVLAQAVVDKVVARAEELGVARVVAVHLLLGEEDEHTEEALRFAWTELSAGTCAQDAALHFERCPGDGLRLAAMDVERDADPGPTPDQRASTREGADPLH